MCRLRVIVMEGQEGLGHVPRPRGFTIDDQSSSELRSQTATGSFRPLHLTGVSCSSPATLSIIKNRPVAKRSVFYFGGPGGT